ncbi:MAG: glycosyltransferase family 4 protein [Candidatus Promineifilaceae bacterium]
MRILHLTPCHWPARGGAQTHLQVVSAYLVQAGHEVTIATSDAHDVSLLWQPNKRRCAQSEDVIDGVRILRFPVRHLLNSRFGFPAVHRLIWLLSKVGATGMARWFGRYIPHVPDLYQWLATTDEQFDIVGGMHLPYDGLLQAGQRFATRTNTPFITYPLTHFGVGKQPGSEPESQFYTMRHQAQIVCDSDALVAQTDFEASYYCERGMAREKTVVGGPGIDLDAIAGGSAARYQEAYTHAAPFVLFLGTLAPSKGAIQTTEAIRLLNRQGVSVELVLAGTITDEFQRYWDAIPAAERATLHLRGYVSDEMRRDLLAACAVFCLPSKMDSFGMVYLEAWRYKKAVIAADSWGVKELVRDGETGLLVAYGDPSTTAEAVQKLLNNPTLATKLGEAGYAQTIAHHSWATKCAIVEQLYLKLAM